MYVKLTEEQQKFMDSLEEEFKDRYTENDKEFKAVLEEEHPLPPVVENWREFRQPDDRNNLYRNNPYDRYRDRNRDRNPYDRSSCDRSNHFRYYNNDRYSHSSRYVHSYRP